MRFNIVAIGTTGDVAPQLALGSGLAKAGHEVTVAAPLNFKQAVIARGLRYAPLGVDLRDIFDEPAGRALLNPEHGVLKLLENSRDLAVPIAERVLADMTPLCRDCEAVLYSLLSFPARILADDAAIPSFACLFQPLWRTGAFPSPLLPVAMGLGSGPNRLTHFAVEQAYWQLFRPLIQRWRRRLGKPPVPIAGPFGEIFGGKHPVLSAFSPHVVPVPADVPPSIRVTGYWSLEPTEHWRPPDALVDFLNAGRQPICLGFGSMKAPHIQEQLETILQALRRRGERAVVLSGWSDALDAHGLITEDLYVTDEVPHDWLFPRVAAVIHHGGAGTTGAALRHGVPSIVIPFFFDQLYWGRRLAALGAGVNPIRPPEVTVDAISSAIARVRTDASLRRCAGLLRQQMASEDGVGHAVEIIERHCA